MDNKQYDDVPMSTDNKSAVQVDEVIYERNPKESNDGHVDDVTDTGHVAQDADAPNRQDETQEEPAPDRSFMDEMFENEGDFDGDDYVDMPSYDELLEENAKLQRQLASVIAQYENLKNDWSNYRKRAKLEIERGKDLASERVATQVIPVIDDLYRSIEHIRTMGEDLIPLANGNEAIANRIIAALSKEGIEVISPLGEPFDVNRHQAIAMEEIEGKKPGIVFRVYQDGYAIGDRVIRPASVGVTK